MKFKRKPSGIGCAFNEKAIERMLVAKFKKKPVVIEAIQWTGDNLSEIMTFMNIPVSPLESFSNQIVIDTLEGEMKAPVGWWIIKGVKGEFYPCDPEIFKMSYEQVEW